MSLPPAGQERGAELAMIADLLALWEGHLRTHTGSLESATQHAGLKEDIKDHRHSTRTVKLNPIFSFLYWQMEYHIEHHMFPMVPSYNLPKLYEVIKDQMPEPQTLYQAYKEIIPAVIKKSKNPDYFIPVQVPNN